MFEKLMIAYTMAMAYDVRSPMPHLVGPPGCGKSSVVEELADALGVNLHIINVSRISPLEIEGVQMPHGTGDEMHLRMLPATFWTSLKDGDIMLLDEFLRGFPEVYNGLLDIFTSRRAGTYRLPKVFIIGASNSVVAYDQALEDRLLHIPVPDPRKSSKEALRLAHMIVDLLGLYPQMAESAEMKQLLDECVLPTYNLLDSFKKKGEKAALPKGVSIRNLVGQAQLRMLKVQQLKSLIEVNNLMAMAAGKAQFVLLPNAEEKHIPALYEEHAAKLQHSKQLTKVQALNLEANLQLIEMAKAMKEKEEA